jgi:hypothetical protein
MSKQKVTDKDAEAMLIGLGANTEQRGSPARLTREPKTKADKSANLQASKPTSKQANIQVSKQENNQTSKQTEKPENPPERTATFSTYLRPSLQKRIKLLSVQRETTTAALVEAALEAYLEANE